MSDKDIINISKIANIPSYSDLGKAADQVNDAVKRLELLCADAKTHIVSMCVSKDLYQKSEYKKSTDKDRTKPTGDDVDHVIREIMNKGYTKPIIAVMVGVSETKNRTIDRWASGGETTSTIPYAAWRLLCAYAGYSIDLALEDRNKKLL